jgi:hypothetical protein
MCFTGNAGEEVFLHTRKPLKRICAHIGRSFEAAMLHYDTHTPARPREHKSLFRPDGAPLLTQEQNLATGVYISERLGALSVTKSGVAVIFIPLSYRSPKSRARVRWPDRSQNYRKHADAGPNAASHRLKSKGSRDT